MSEITTYTKMQSNFISDLVQQDDIIFHDVTFEKIETESRLPTDELENLDIFDPNTYKKQ